KGRLKCQAAACEKVEATMNLQRDWSSRRAIKSRTEDQPDREDGRRRVAGRGHHATPPRAGTGRAAVPGAGFDRTRLRSVVGATVLASLLASVPAFGVFTESGGLV